MITWVPPRPWSTSTARCSWTSSATPSKTLTIVSSPTCAILPSRMSLKMNKTSKSAWRSIRQITQLIANSSMRWRPSWMSSHWSTLQTYQKYSTQSAWWACPRLRESARPVLRSSGPPLPPMSSLVRSKSSLIECASLRFCSASYTLTNRMLLVQPNNRRS